MYRAIKVITFSACNGVTEENQRKFADSKWKQVIGNINNNTKCIKETIMMGNKACYANRQPVNSSLISRNSQQQIYRTAVRPVVTGGSELWTLTVGEERALAVFERENTAENIWTGERKRTVEN